MSKTAFTTLVLFLTLLLIVMLVIVNMQLKAQRIWEVSLDIPESECEFPVYTSQGDYALCIK